MMALKPDAGTVTRYSWVLCDSITRKFHVWPVVSDVLKTELVNVWKQVSAAALHIALSPANVKAAALHVDA